MGLRMDAAYEIRSSERELMTGSGACRAKVHACRALAFFTRLTFMRRRGTGELPYNSRPIAPSCLSGRLMSDIGQIGIASLWERLCTYVYISVFAVSFKKKQYS